MAVNDSSSGVAQNTTEETKTIEIEVNADQADDLYMALTARCNELREWDGDYSEERAFFSEIEGQLFEAESELRGWDDE